MNVCDSVSLRRPAPLPLSRGFGHTCKRFVAGKALGAEMAKTDQLSITSLPLEQAAKLLAKAGSQRASVALLQRELEAGAPRNGDGTLNLIHYAAWVAREEARAERDAPA